MDLSGLPGSFWAPGGFVEDGEWYDLPEDFWEPVKRPQGSLEDTDTTRDLSGSLLVPGAFIEDVEWWETPENVLGSVNRSPGFSDDTSVVVAVMGATGAGKSTFIKMVSGRDDVVVGNTLSSGR
jgi:GTPase